MISTEQDRDSAPRAEKLADGEVRKSLKLLTNSRMKAGRACQRKHHLLYDLGIRPAVEADVLRFGTLFHLGLEQWWLAIKSGADPLAAALAAISGEADPFERARAEVLLTGYHFRWIDDAAKYEVISVEAEFRCALVNPQTGRPSRTWELAGKIDVTLRERATGRELVVEHKTSSEEIEDGSDYWKRLRIDGQVSLYFEGGRSLGLDVAACLYDVIRKPGIRPSQVPLVDADGVKIVRDAAGERVRTKDGKKWRETADSSQGYALQTRDETVDEFRTRLVAVVTEAPEKFFRRAEVPRLEGEVEEALWDVWQIAQQIHAASEADRFPRNPDACSSFGRTCPFFDVCTHGASLDDSSRFKRLENVHPELSFEAAPI